MKLSCNLNRLIHWKENITWKEIIMLLIFIVVATNGIYHTYIK